MYTSKDLLLIIDMQNVYLPGNPWACRKTEEAADQIIRLISSGKAWQTIFTIFTAPSSPTGIWKQYNLENREINENEYLNEIIAPLKPYSQRYPVMEKSVYSSYAIPELRKLADEADHILMTGVVAECCVLFTALSAIDAGHKVYYLKDAVSGFTAQTEAETEHILSCLSPLHTEIMTVEEYLSL